MPSLFVEAMKGELDDWNFVFSRYDFELLKDTEDPMLTCMASFGNRPGNNYLWGKDKEDIRYIASNMILANTAYERRMWYKAFIKNIRSRFLGGGHIQQIERLERIQQVEQLEHLQPPKVIKKDYRDVSIKENSIIYCDPPYEGTKGYKTKFNHKGFWQYVRESPCMVVVSEYNAPDDFSCIAKKETRTTMDSNSNRKHVEEKLFVHTDKLDQYEKAMGKLLLEEGKNGKENGKNNRNQW